jgi:alkanesulfonate monooxygenase SsuD/methylene tetrahydromethanopterin reductase-like flavin-dependent oxidoreductase (luciferase family)
VKMGLAVSLHASAERKPVDLYAQFLDDMQHADGMGFSTVMIAEHRFISGPWCPSPIVAAAGVAGGTTHLRVGTWIQSRPKVRFETPRYTGRKRAAP